MKIISLLGRVSANLYNVYTSEGNLWLKTYPDILMRLKIAWTLLQIWPVLDFKAKKVGLKLLSVLVQAHLST